MQPKKSKVYCVNKFVIKLINLQQNERYDNDWKGIWLKRC